MNIELKHQQQVLSESLSYLGFKLIAAHAKTETNTAIMHGYAKIAEYEALKRGELSILDRLNFVYLIGGNC